MKNALSLILFCLCLGLASSCIEENYFGNSTNKKITSFKLPQQLSASNIDHDSLIIRLTVSQELDLTSVVPSELTISNFATITPDIDVAQDFSVPVDYTITAEDGSSNTYTIYVETNEPKIQLENSDFETWYTTSGGYSEIGPAQGEGVWATGNAGVVTLGTANNIPLDVNGNTVAQLITRDLGFIAQPTGQRIASGSLFTGVFQLNILNPSASAVFGTPFIARPDSIQIDYKYTRGNQMMDGRGNHLSGVDSLDIVVLLEDRSSSDIKRVATAWFRSDQTTADWQTLKIPLTYGQISSPKQYEIPENGLWGSGSETPTHISVILASSARGAIFEGAPGSELLVDNFKLIYN